MTIRHRLELETVSLITLSAFVGVFIAAYNNNYLPKSNIFSIIPTTIETETPAITPLAQPKSTSQISPDGTKKVIMRTVSTEDNIQTYLFSTADNSGTNEQAVFKKNLDITKTMTIPFNTWSPDNKYFFIQEQTSNGVVTDILIFQALGEPFASGEKYLNAVDLFKNRNSGNYFNEATGWASETLIIINSNTPDAAKGPSYWLEIPSKAIIQLSTDF